MRLGFRIKPLAPSAPFGYSAECSDAGAGTTPERAAFLERLPRRSGAFRGCCTDAEPTIISTTSEAALALESAVGRAERWFGEPFLHPGEEADVALAPGTARRRALDDATDEMEAGHRSPSPGWKVRYGLMLGLERVLAAETPQTAAGTTLRRHQIDALAGMLTELIAATQRSADENGNGAATAASPSSSRRWRTRTTRTPGSSTRSPSEPTFEGEDPGAVAALPLPPSRPRPARRSPPPGSSRRRATSAS